MNPKNGHKHAAAQALLRCRDTYRYNMRPCALSVGLLLTSIFLAQLCQALEGGLPRRPRVHSRRGRGTGDGQLSSSNATPLDLPWSRYRAVTVVHEPCSTLAFTLTNFAGNLGPDWPLLVVYTPKAEAAVLGAKTVQYMSRYGSLDAVPLSALGIPGLDELATVTQYSRLLVHPHFWQAMHAEKVLTFQVDSVLCSGSAFSVDDFLAYDYIGAPWIHNNNAVGNGGLSLRSVDRMLHIARHHNRTAHPEDVFFVEGLADIAQGDEAVVRAPASVAQKFSWEMDRQPPSYVPFGLHRSPIVPESTKTAILAGCPEAGIGVWSSCGRRAVVV